MNKLKLKDIVEAKQVIVIGAAKNMHRQYYDAPFIDNNAKAPVCFSSDSTKPDVKAPVPQAKFCMTCTKNIKGSGEGGTKACRLHQKIAVSEYDNLKGPVYQFIVTSQSLFNKSDSFEGMGFLQYVKKLMYQGQSISSVVTKITKTNDGMYSKVSFKPVAYLNRRELDYLQQRSNSEEVDDCLSFYKTLDLLESNHFSDVKEKMGMVV